MAGKKYLGAFAAVILILLWVALALIGGPANGFDTATIDGLAAQRLAHPFLTHLGIWISFAGSAPITLTLPVLAAAYLIWHGRHRGAAALFAIVLGGRLMVEILKLSIARPRPGLEMHAVTVNSPSFPSAHAANSMIAFAAIALFWAPQRHRKAALAIAIAASLVIGATRPLLGVHWPSDVLAGWIFGLLWVAGWWRCDRVHKGYKPDGGAEPKLPDR